LVLGISKGHVVLHQELYSKIRSATIDDAVGPVTVVAGDPLRLALDVVAAREVDQRARNQHPNQSAQVRIIVSRRDLLPLTAHMHARTCCSTRVHRYHFSKEPHGRCGGERCA
jgi:hypothetical protein